VVGQEVSVRIPDIQFLYQIHFFQAWQVSLMINLQNMFAVLIWQGNGRV